MKKSEKLRMRISLPLMVELKAVSNEEQISVSEAARRVLVNWCVKRVMLRGTVGSVVSNNEVSK